MPDAAQPDSEPVSQVGAARSNGDLFNAGGIDDDVLKPLKWDAQAKSTKLSVDPAPTAAPQPLKMPTAPTFDDEDESQPLDSLAAPVPPAVEDLNPSAVGAKGAESPPSFLPKGPILAPKSPSAIVAKQSEAVASPESAAGTPKLPQLGLGSLVKPAAATSASVSVPASPEASVPERKPEIASSSPVPAKVESPQKAPPKPQQPAPAGGWMSRSPDFILRALLSMDGTPTCENVVDHCVGLPGVAECLVLRAGAVVPGSNRSGSAGALASVTEGAFEKVTGLVREMGILTADALTIQLDSGTLSFFVDDSACLAVLQESSTQLGPGLRERLTLISQQLGAIPLA